MHISMLEGRYRSIVLLLLCMFYHVYGGDIIAITIINSWSWLINLKKRCLF